MLNFVCPSKKSYKRRLSMTLAMDDLLVKGRRKKVCYCDPQFDIEHPNTFVVTISWLACFHPSSPERLGNSSSTKSTSAINHAVAEDLSNDKAHKEAHPLEQRRERKNPGFILNGVIESPRP